MLEEDNKNVLSIIEASNNRKINNEKLIMKLNTMINILKLQESSTIVMDKTEILELLSSYYELKMKYNEDEETDEEEDKETDEEEDKGCYDYFYIY